MFYLKKNRKEFSMNTKLVVKHIGDRYVVAHSYGAHQPGGHREVVIMKNVLESEYEHVTDPQLKAIWFAGFVEVPVK